MSFFDTTQTDLLAILAADGEPLTYNDRDGGANVLFTTVMHRNGPDGDATVNIPLASVTSPLFADKITDANAVVWYISEARETLQGRTYCDLKLNTYWELVTFEYFTSGAWATHTTAVNVMIQADSSFEDLDEFFTETTEYTVKSQDLDSITQKMRIKRADSSYLYITGIRPDDSGGRFTEFDCREDEA